MLLQILPVLADKHPEIGETIKRLCKELIIKIPVCRVFPGKSIVTYWAPPQGIRISTVIQLIEDAAPFLLVASKVNNLELLP